MSFRTDTVGATQAEPATPAVKRNFNTAITLGGATGQVEGSVIGAFVKLPASFGAGGNQMCIMFGADTDRDGIVNEANETGLVIGGPTSATGPLRPRYRFNTSTVGSENFPQMALSGSYGIWKGTTNRGTNAAPLWVDWIAYCDLATGTVHSWTQAHNTTFTASTTFGVLATIFAAAGASNTRTPVGIEQEHLGYINGGFPWDTANDGSVTGSVSGQGRPHHDAIRSLCGFGTPPFHTYETLVAAMNAGTLTYSNLRSNDDTTRTAGAIPSRAARAEVTEWFEMANIANLANRGANSSNSLALVNYNSLSGGLVSGATRIAPAHWAPAGPTAPTINTPRRLFQPGRGLRPTVRTGTYDVVNTTALERRYVYGDNPVNPGAVAGAVVFDWSTNGIVMADGEYTCTQLLPKGGPYTVQTRDANNTALVSAPLSGNMVGLRVLMHGQSAMALSIRTGTGGTPLGPNLLNISVAAGALGSVMRLDNMYAQGGDGGVYAPPAAAVGVMRGDETPAVGHGAILFQNEYFACVPGEPLDICNMAINTHSMDSWTANEVIPDGDPTWRFMGPATPTLPGAANGNDSGVVSLFAWILESEVDLHMLMWSPGISPTEAGRAAYRAAIDTRFFNSPLAPWLIIPPWRFHRSDPDGNAGPTIRDRHVAFVDELNLLTPGRGILGPVWHDVINDGNASGHPAFNSSLGVPDAVQNVSDANYVGQARIGISFGRTVAWVDDRTIQAHGAHLVLAYFTDAGRTAIRLDFGRRVRTVNGAALYAGAFWISTNNGASFINSGFTAVLAPDGCGVILTKDGGTSWPEFNVRADIHWFNPFGPLEMPLETSAEAAINGLLCDYQTYRSAPALAALLRLGNPLQGTSKAGAGRAGVPVTAAPGAQTLFTTELFDGERLPEFELVTADGLTVLATKTFDIEATVL